MKKNRMLKIASAMIMLCLITTCVIGTTFAKYTTADSASDTARVAKWGVEVSTSGTMFGKHYGANDALENADRIVASTSGSVDTSSTDKVVAPGTKNDTGIQIKLKGKPEVSFKFTATSANIKDIFLNEGTYGTMVKAYGLNAASDMADIYLFNGTNYVKEDIFNAANADKYYKLMDQVTVAAGTKYYPIKWTGKIVATDTEGVGSGTQEFATLEAAVTNLVDGINALYALGLYKANTNVDLTYTLTWAWAFDGGHDAEDTILGNIIAMSQDAAANKVVVLQGVGTYKVVEDVTNYSLSVGCDIEVTATQLD